METTTQHIRELQVKMGSMEIAKSSDTIIIPKFLRIEVDKCLSNFPPQDCSSLGIQVRAKQSRNIVRSNTISIVGTHGEEFLRPIAKLSTVKIICPLAHLRDKVKILLDPKIRWQI